jgi:uncharacterized membrane-anchored protein
MGALIVFGLLGAALFLATLPKLVAMNRRCPHIYRTAVVAMNIGGAMMVLEAAYGQLIGLGVITAAVGLVVLLASRHGGIHVLRHRR